ncbi:hypothetical protein WR25_16407 [Diploscapter pachys]|uniref:Uncharacterized protein n=1 Tax=Diploscapter pachys TaxID=2018661 RepID=A0A2A2L8B2_9BILA|nr:hypothetical protein WR25_16407 [Diploscapter pachys]
MSYRIFVLPLLLTFAELASGNRSNHIEDPDSVQVNSSTPYTISAFTPKIFVKTDVFLLNYTQCAQFRYKLEEKKVRLRAYTCLISEGGFCTLDKFSYPKDTEGCDFLRPWHYNADSFTFYFYLERRPRKYGPVKQAQMKRRRHAKRQSKTPTVSAKPFGQLQLDGIMPCSEICDGRGAKHIIKTGNHLD